MAMIVVRFNNISTYQPMESLCDRAIRCLCWCLIKKESVDYAEASDQHSKFMAANEHVEEQHPHKAESRGQELSQKVANYFQEEQATREKPDKNNSVLDLPKDQYGHQEETSLLKYEEEHKLQDYTDAMDPQHPYFGLFKDKLYKLASVFEIPDKASRADPDTSYPLRLHCYQEGKCNVFVYFFKFPSDIETYESISNDFDLQKKFDSNIEEFKKQYEVVGGDARLIYLSYKKVLMMSSRDFEYVKYSFKKGNEHWSICTSDPSREQIKDKVRGQMVLTATRIVQLEGEIDVAVYSQIDMKIPIKLEIAKNRGFAEIRKYLDKVHTHIKNNEHKII